MGKYTDEADTFNKNITSICNSLGDISTQIGTIRKDLSAFEKDVIASNVSVRLDAIETQKNNIISSLQGISSQVMNEAQELDRKIEEHLKAAENLKKIRRQIIQKKLEKKEE